MSDLISRQAVLDILSWRNSAWDAYSKVVDLPSAQPEQKTGKWIAVTERLPEKNGDYIAFSIGGTWNQLSTIELAFWDGASFIPQSFFTVTHWMPLPEPPTIIEAEESET